jgi:hypothetical protein
MHWMHLKVFLKLKKKPKTLSSGQMYKKTKKPKKLLVFFLPGFFATLRPGGRHLHRPDHAGGEPHRAEAGMGELHYYLAL